jgi:hypothetical protein
MTIWRCPPVALPASNFTGSAAAVAWGSVLLALLSVGDDSARERWRACTLAVEPSNTGWGMGKPQDAVAPPRQQTSPESPGSSALGPNPTFMSPAAKPPYVAVINISVK